MTPLVSVVIVAYRSRAHLSECLRSVAAQPEPLEVIVVDNASADGTVALVRAELPAARVLVNEFNVGFAAAVNQGVREARGRFLLLLNPDASLAGATLTALVSATTGRVGLAGARLVGPDGSPQPSAWQAPGLCGFVFDALLLRNLAPRSRLDHIEAPESGAPLPVGCLSGACLLIRRECWEATSGLDERFFLYHEDWDLCLRARAAGWECVLVPEARAVHVLGGSAFQDRAAFVRRYHESRDAFIRKHWSGAHRLALLALHRAGILVRIVAYGLAGALGDAQRRADAAQHVALLTAGWRSP